MMDADKLLKEFFDDHKVLVDKEQASPIDRAERMAIEYFVDWLGSRGKGEIMNIKEELEKMQEELSDMEDKTLNLSNLLNNAWWKLQDKVKELD